MMALCEFPSSTLFSPALVSFAAASQGAIDVLPGFDTIPAEAAWMTADIASGRWGMTSLFAAAAPDAGLSSRAAATPASSTATTASDAGLFRQGVFHWKDGSHPTLTDAAILAGVVLVWEGAKWFFFRRGETGSRDPMPAAISARAKAQELSPAEQAFLSSYTAAPNSLVVLVGEWHAAKYERKLQRMLEAFLAATPHLSDGFFEVCRSLAEAYVERHPRPQEHLRDPWTEAHVLQLVQLMRSERIVTDRRFLSTLERAARHSVAPPITYDLFAEGSGSRMKLKEGVTIQLAQAVKMWASEERLWDGEFGRIFFTNVARAVKVLSVDHPEETTEARKILLREAWRNQYARREIGWIFEHRDEVDRERPTLREPAALKPPGNGGRERSQRLES